MQMTHWPVPPWAYRPRPGRPGSLTAAAVILIVLGSLVLLIAVPFLVGGLVWDSIVSDPSFRQELEVESDPAVDDVIGQVGPLIVIFGVVLLLSGAAHVASGIGTLMRRGWARMVGLLLATIGEVLALIVIGVGVVILLTPASQPRDPSCPESYTFDQCQSLTASGAIVQIVFFTGVAATYGFVAYALIRRGRWFDREGDASPPEWAPTGAAPSGYYAPAYPPPGYYGGWPYGQPAPAPAADAPDEGPSAPRG